MLIETQITPDVNVINFFPAEKVLRSGTAEFVDAKSLRKSPLAEAIFDHLIDSDDEQEQG